VAGVLGIIGMKILEKYRAEWARAVIYGLGAAALFMVIFVGARGITFLSAIPKQPLPITIDTVESNVRSWLEDFNLSVRKVNDVGTFFRFDVQLRDGRGITVRRTKDRDKYILLGADVVFSDTQKFEVSNLSKDQRFTIEHDLNLELARLNVQFEAAPIPNRVVVETGLPITNSLNEDEVIRAVLTIANAVIVADETVLIDLHHFGISLTRP
jgi:hypothetical protein